jgi:hypothetical protein
MPAGVIPDADIVRSELNARWQTGALALDEIDVGLAYCRATEPKAHIERLLDSGWGLLIRRDHRFA